MSNTFENIFFWITFVGFAIFLVRAVQATVILKTQNLKDYTQSESIITLATATLAILFATVAVSNRNNPTMYNTKQIKDHTEVGKVILYDSVDEKHDTLIIYKHPTDK